MIDYAVFLLLAAGLPYGCSAGNVKGGAGGAGSAEAECRSDVAKTEEAQLDVTTFDLRRAVYVAEDSAEVVKLLGLPVEGGSDVLHFARHFLGRPYVGHTLEVCDPERLVVNLRELDCTTLVETVVSLVRCHRRGERSFEAFCYHLERIRYRGGEMDGYLSRLHYFDWWMRDNVAKRFVREVSDSLHWTAKMVVRDTYMSAQPEKYKMLRLHPEWADSIRRMERRWNGSEGAYLPEAATGLKRADLPAIEDGDIVAIVTTKAGLDYSHLGFAVWGADGRLHLLNASSIHKQVVEEPKTLRRYLREHPSSVGIRLLRIL